MTPRKVWAMLATGALMLATYEAWDYRRRATVVERYLLLLIANPRTCPIGILDRQVVITHANGDMYACMETNTWEVAK